MVGPNQVPDGLTYHAHYPPLPLSEHYHGPIWHFTDAYALVSIVERRKLWATAATMLNDPKEQIYGAERIVEWYERSGSEIEGDSSFHSLLTTQMNTLVSDVLDRPAYVVCASTDHRLINQWRNYGGTTGVAIQLEAHADLTPHELPKGGLLLEPQWVEVKYEVDDQDTRIRNVLSDLASRSADAVYAPNTLDLRKPLVHATLASLAASLKDSAYKEEHEVRLITYPAQDVTPSHRGSSRGVVPYLEISHFENYGWAAMGLEGIANANAQLPILAVRVGPPEGESERQRIVGVKSLLNAHGLDVPVNGSTIPYLPTS